MCISIKCMINIYYNFICQTNYLQGIVQRIFFYESANFLNFNVTPQDKIDQTIFNKELGTSEDVSVNLKLIVGNDYSSNNKSIPILTSISGKTVLFFDESGVLKLSREYEFDSIKNVHNWETLWTNKKIGILERMDGNGVGWYV